MQFGSVHCIMCVCVMRVCARNCPDNNPKRVVRDDVYPISYKQNAAHLGAADHEWCKRSNEQARVSHGRAQPVATSIVVQPRQHPLHFHRVVMLAQCMSSPGKELGTFIGINTLRAPWTISTIRCVWGVAKRQFWSSCLCMLMGSADARGFLVMAKWQCLRVSRTFTRPQGGVGVASGRRRLGRW